MIKHEKSGLPVVSVMIFLGLFAAMVAIAIGKRAGVIENSVAQRSVGIVLGLMLIGVGNLLPKFRLFDSPRRDPAQTLAAERFAGWVFVITGTAYVLIWTFAPTASVKLVSSIVGLGSFGLVALDWIRRSIANTMSTAGRQVTETTLAKRILLGTLLLSIGWVFAVFLVDHIWGDAASQWVAVISPIVVGALLAMREAGLLATREG